jgi:hypothetical protein
MFSRYLISAPVKLKDWNFGNFYKYIKCELLRFWKILPNFQTKKLKTIIVIIIRIRIILILF